MAVVKGLKWIFRLIFFCALAIAGLVLLTYWGFATHFNPERVRGQLVDRFSSILDLPVTIKKVQWSFFPLPSLVGQNIRILGRDGELIVSAPEIRCWVIPWSIQKKQIQISEIVFVDPEIYITFEKGKKSSLEELSHAFNNRKTIPNEQKPKKIFFNKFVLKNAFVRFSNGLHSEKRKEISFILNGKGSLHEKARRFNFTASAHGTAEKPVGLWQFNGMIGEKTLIDAKVSRFPLDSLTVYWPRWSRLSGDVTAGGWLFRESGSDTVWSIKGEISPLAIKEPGPKVKGNATWAIASDRPLQLTVNASNLGSSVILDMTFPDLKKEFLNFDFKSSRFKFEEVMSWTKPFILKSPKGTQKQWRSEGRVEVGFGSIGKFKFSDYSSDLTIHKGQWDFKKLYGLALGGKIDGSLKIVIPGGPNREGKPVLTFSGAANEIRAEQLFSIWQTTPIISGNMNLFGELTGGVSNTFIKEAKGRVNVQVWEGGLNEFPTVLKVVSRLNLKSAFKRKDEEEKKVKYAFKNIEGTLVFDRGTVRTDKFILESDTLSLKAKGNVNLVAGTVDARVSVRVLTLVDEILKGVPFISKIYRKTKSIIPFWTHVKGRLGEPDVTVSDSPD